MRSARLAFVAAAALAVLVFGAAPAGADTTNPKHFFWGQGYAAPSADALTNDIIYHGGSAGPGAIGVEIKPAVYLVYWGPEWAQGFTVTDANGRTFSSKTLQTYLNSFFANVGGSPWAGVQTQYCRNVLAGTTSCAGIPGAELITNPKRPPKGTCTDRTPVPDDIVT